MPSGPTLLPLGDGAAVAEAVAQRMLLERQWHPDRPLGLATGRTMEPVYRRFAELVAALPQGEAERLRRDWCSFNLDAYVGLAPSDPRSFAAEMEQRLVQPLGLDPRRVRLPDGLAADPAGEARRYGAAVAAAGGIGLQLLGLGLNGHVGFNEPPCPATAPCRALELSEATRHQNAAAFGGDPAAVPARAITLGMAEILAAERILLVVTGAAKAAILRSCLQEPPGPERPASWLQHHPDVTVIVDAAALGAGVN
ncbi:glucosamine-6-phosphate deaminase [Cyanobium sp. FGCU-52]|nr:glucosamine-6-phosphate deaminase [Cyanobium sp. FGCU52]